VTPSESGGHCPIALKSGGNRRPLRPIACSTPGVHIKLLTGGMCIHSINQKKGQLKIFGKVAVDKSRPAKNVHDTRV